MWKAWVTTLWIHVCSSVASTIALPLPNHCCSCISYGHVPGYDRTYDHARLTSLVMRKLRALEPGVLLFHRLCHTRLRKSGRATRWWVIWILKSRDHLRSCMRVCPLSVWPLNILSAHWLRENFNETGSHLNLYAHLYAATVSNTRGGGVA